MEPTTDRTRTVKRQTSPAVLWVLALVPLTLLGLLLALIGKYGATETLRGDAPPVEALTFQRVELTPTGIDLIVLNDGSDPVSIAQVIVDEAYWSYTQQPPGPLHHLARARLHIPYPWVRGEAHGIRLITATGATFDHQVAVAVETPRPSWKFLAIFTLIGTYVGVLPVALGLLWYPVIRRLGRWGLDLVIALTLGLLLFLLVDTGHEGFEAAGLLARSYQGLALFLIAAFLAYLLIESLGAWLQVRAPTAESGWVTARLVAIGIGLHNFGEGLAIGAAFTLGEVALGTLLVIGFTLHNTTEGLAIVAPLAKVQARFGQLALLGLIAGVPTIVGVWVGGFVHSVVWSVVFLAVGAGAIAQVVVQITRQVAGDRSPIAYLRSGRVMGGLTAGFTLMYLTGMLVG